MPRRTFKILAEDPDYFEVESYLRKEFRKNRAVYPSDISEALGIDYGTVREIIARMIHESKLEPAR